MDKIPDDPTIIEPLFQKLRKTFASGKTRDMKYRKQQLQNLITGLQEMEKELHEAWIKDLGGNEFTSQGYSYYPTLNEVKETLHSIEAWNAPEKRDANLLILPSTCYLLPEPLGTILVVGAWNYPLSLSVPYVAAAIAAGNTCMLKMSEMSAATSNVVAKLFKKYMDQDAFVCVEGQTQVAIKVTNLPFDKIVFTGSPEKGRLVAMAAAKNLTPCVLELGGKSPTIVGPEADLDNACLRIAQAKWVNSGQTCVACDYCYVHESIKGKFIDKLRDTCIKYYGENPAKSEDYGRMINEFHANRMKKYLEENHGGKIVIGGECKVSERYIEPTIIDSPKMESQMMNDEIFGPLFPIFGYTDFEKVVEYINSKPKPLALYYFGNKDSKEYQALKTRTSSGALLLNDALLHFANSNLSFGGVGYSGIGVVHGKDGFREMVHMKPITERGTYNGFPFQARYPPYSASKKKMMLDTMKKANLSQSTVVNALLFVLACIIAGFVYKFAH